jgi:hypothetical protein
VIFLFASVLIVDRRRRRGNARVVGVGV